MKSLLLSFLFAAFAAVSSHAQVTAFFYTGTGPVPQGRTETLLPNPWTFQATRLLSGSWQNDIGITVSRINGGNYEYWYISLSPPAGSDFVTGQTYQASLWQGPPQSMAGIEFEGNGRSNDSLIGQFTIVDFVTGGTGQLTSFGVDFAYQTNGLAEAFDHGSFRFNSSVPLDLNYGVTAVPEPSTYAMLLGGSRSP